MTGAGANTDVLIRPYRLEDVKPLCDAVQSSMPELAPWMPWCHPRYGRQDARTWIERQIEAFQRGLELQFAIVAPDQRLLGGCGLNAIDAANRLANLGYWVRTDSTRRGVATTAARSLVRWAYRHTELDRLEIVASTANHASQRVAEKVGAFREGILRRRLVLRGTPHDAVVYSITRG